MVATFPPIPRKLDELQQRSPERLPSITSAVRRQSWQLVPLDSALPTADDAAAEVRQKSAEMLEQQLAAALLRADGVITHAEAVLKNTWSSLLELEAWAPLLPARHDSSSHVPRQLAPLTRAPPEPAKLRAEHKYLREEVLQEAVLTP